MLFDTLIHSSSHSSMSTSPFSSIFEKEFSLTLSLSFLRQDTLSRSFSAIALLEIWALCRGTGKIHLVKNQYM